LGPPRGLRFGGNGFAAMNTRGENAFHFMDKFDISFQFKTFASNGLLYMLKQSTSEYLAISMVGGHVQFQLNLGSGATVLTTPERYNDGTWRRVEAAREGRQAILKVDNLAVTGETGGSFEVLSFIPEHMYLGGYPGPHMIPGVTTAGFTGCMNDVNLSQLQFDLSKSSLTRNTMPGCPAETASLVSWTKPSPGYIQMSSPEESGLKLVFKFRTSEPNGLLFLTTNRQESAFLSLSLNDGALVFRAQPGGQISEGSHNKYNDSEWHVVIAAHENNELLLDIDDYDTHDLTLREPSYFDGAVYFGGVPPHIARSPALSRDVPHSFAGCIGDATVNGEVVDFSNTTDAPNARLQACDLSPLEDGVFIPPFGETDLTTPQYELREVVTPDSTRTFSESWEETVETFEENVETFETVVTSRTVDWDRYDYGEPSSTEMSLPPLAQCALPIQTEDTKSYTMDTGIRFRNTRDSRIEYESLPSVIGRQFKFGLAFKTFTGDGIIFYSSTMSHTNFFAVYMKSGTVHVRYDLGTGIKKLTSVFTSARISKSSRIQQQTSFADNVWHSLTIDRSADMTRLYIDGALAQEVADDTSGYVYREHQSPAYLGGVLLDRWDSIKENVEGSFMSFDGCLRAFRLDSQRVGDGMTIHNVKHCGENVEHGIYFGEGLRAHVILQMRFNVGAEFSMSMSVRPRTNNAVIMSVHGRRDFLMLQLRDGVAELSADNGKGIIKATIEPPTPYYFCNGQWHTVSVTKIKELLVLRIGDMFSSASGSTLATTIQTNHPLFLGSQPRLSKRRGQPVTDKFMGCIKNVTVDDRPFVLADSYFVGNVNAGSCPSD